MQKYAAYLPKEVVEKSLELIDDPKCSLERRLTFLLVLDAGLRPKEIADLQGDAVNVKAKKLSVNNRSIPLLSNQLFNALKEWFGKTNLVISTPPETRYFLWKLGKKAGSERRLTANSLRWVFAANYLNSGRSMEELSEVLGHANERITRDSVHDRLKKL